jgi:hypothetical protein
LFDPQPVELGFIQYYQPEEFDWKAFADIDDMLKLEVFDPTGGVVVPIEEEVVEEEVLEVVVEGGGEGAATVDVENITEGEAAEQPPLISKSISAVNSNAEGDLTTPLNNNNNPEEVGVRPHYDVSDDEEENEVVVVP